MVYKIGKEYVEAKTEKEAVDQWNKYYCEQMGQEYNSASNPKKKPVKVSDKAINEYLKEVLSNVAKALNNGSFIKEKDGWPTLVYKDKGSYRVAVVCEKWSPGAYEIEVEAENELHGVGLTISSVDKIDVFVDEIKSAAKEAERRFKNLKD